MFINHELINSLLEDAKNSTSDDIEKVLDKADRREKLSYKDIATLLEVEDKKQLDKSISKDDIFKNNLEFYTSEYNKLYEKYNK